jgi:hypothetical protein
MCSRGQLQVLIGLSQRLFFFPAWHAKDLLAQNEGTDVFNIQF